MTDYRTPEQKEGDLDLRVIARKIVAAAKGKICGTCTYYRDGWCAKHTNVHGDALKILYPGAPACPSHSDT